jgi:hypothetical protein
MKETLVNVDGTIACDYYSYIYKQARIHKLERNIKN